MIFIYGKSQLLKLKKIEGFTISIIFLIIASILFFG